MTEDSPVSKPPFALYFMGPARSAFDRLAVDHQRCLDDAFMQIEWEPEPADAVALEDTNEFAVIRCGFVISYELTDEGIDVWDIVPRE
jgi:hypothetical protein